MHKLWIAALLIAVSCDAQQPAYQGADYRTKAARIAHGRRLADVLDCTGCHGPSLEGSNLADTNLAEDAMYAPNITLLLGAYSDAELDRLIRQGVPRDGREFWLMPVESYQFLSEPDFSALVSYLRSIRPSGKPLPAFKFNRLISRDVERGLLGNAESQIKKYRAERPADLGPQHAWGRYLVQTTCTVCHNGALQGWEGFTPGLDIVTTYSDDELDTLLTTGKGRTRADLGRMSDMGRRVFSRFTPRERSAVIAYLQARARRH